MLMHAVREVMSQKTYTDFEWQQGSKAINRDKLEITKKQT
jgi:hypothetical protein